MSKFSETLINNLNEMEFLTKTLQLAEIHYCSTNQNLSQIISQTRLCLLNATLDLVIDLDRKINQHSCKESLIKVIVKNLENAVSNLRYFPDEQKVTKFDEIEIEISMILDFVKEYAINGEQIISNLSLHDIKLLNNKFLTIKLRRII